MRSDGVGGEFYSEDRDGETEEDQKNRQNKRDGGKASWSEVWSLPAVAQRRVRVARRRTGYGAKPVSGGGVRGSGAGEVNGRRASGRLGCVAGSSEPRWARVGLRWVRLALQVEEGGMGDVAACAWPQAVAEPIGGRQGAMEGWPVPDSKEKVGEGGGRWRLGEG